MKESHIPHIPRKTNNDSVQNESSARSTEKNSTNGFKNSLSFDKQKNQISEAVYITSHPYAKPMDELLEYLATKESWSKLDIEKSPNFFGKTEKGVLAEYNYDHLRTQIGSQIDAMFIPYLQERESECGTIGNNVPTYVKEKYAEFKKANLNEQASELSSGMIFLKIMGIVDFANPTNFNNMLPHLRNGILEQNNTIRLVRKQLGIANSLPDQYADCIKNNESRTDHVK